MNELEIYGEGGGGKGGGGHTPIEADDTLISKQSVKLLFAVSEGEITGIDDVFTNNTSIKNFAHVSASGSLVDYPVITAPTTSASILTGRYKYGTTALYTAPAGAKLVTWMKYNQSSTPTSAVSACAWLPNNSIIKDSSDLYYKLVRVGVANNYEVSAEPIDPPGVPITQDGISSNTIQIDSRVGTVDQTYISGFDSTRTPSAGSFPVLLANGTTTILSFQGNIDGVIVTMMIDRLMLVEEDGDRVEHEVSGTIQRAGLSGTYSEVEPIYKKGKCTSPYSWDIRVDRPSDVTLESQTWSIRVGRVSPDDADDKHYSKLYLSNVQQVIDQKLTYPRTALLSIVLTDPDQFGGSVPDLKFKIRGMKLPLPSNYTVSNPFTDAETRAYNESSPWNGSFSSVHSYTDNPAWIMYWLLRGKSWESDPGYDWGLRIPASDIDLGSFYNLAKYCDGVVSYTDNNVARTEFRYTAHLSFYEREDIPTALMKILTLCNANLTTNEFGQISITWDAPGQAVTKIVTNANVIEGAFSYSSSDMESRSTVVNVTFNRDDFNGESDTVTVSESVLVERYGYQTSDVILLGCKSRAQATRKARWALYTNCYCTEIVTFKQLFQGATYHIGELIQIQDSDALTVEPKHGVVSSVVTNLDGSTTVNFDRTLTTGTTEGKFTFYIHSEDTTSGQVFTQQPVLITEVTKTGLASTLTAITHTFESGKVPFAGTTFSLSSTTIPAKLYKVVKIDKDDDQSYTITANIHTEDKYAYIDGALTLTTPSLTSGLSPYVNYPVPAVTNLVVGEIYSTTSGVASASLELSWDWENVAPVPISAIFDVTIKFNGDEVYANNTVTSKSVVLPNALPGSYSFIVIAKNPRTGMKSAKEAIYGFKFGIEEGESTLSPPTNIYVKGTTGLEFFQQDLNLTWSYNPANDTTSNTKKRKLKYYQVDIKTMDNVLKATYVVTSLRPDKGADFNFRHSENVAIFGSATRQFKVVVYSRDTINDLSPGYTITVVNNPPAAVTGDVTGDAVNFSLKITSAPSVDHVGYKVWRGTTSNFTINDAALVYKGNSNPILLPIKDESNYYYAFAEYDNFSEDNLNVTRFGSNVVGTSAERLRTVADQAKTDADAARATLNEIASDAKITQGEKSGVFLQWKTIYAEKPDILAKATAAGLGSATETTDYTTGYNDLVSYLTSSPISIPSDPTDPTNEANWCTSTTTIDITAMTFRSKFAAYYSRKVMLLNAVADAAYNKGVQAQSSANTAQSAANTAQSTANDANQAAAAANNNANSRMLASATNVLSGFGTVQVGDTATGVLFTSNGLLGRKAGVTTFSIDTTGTAVFAGSITGATGWMGDLYVEGGQLRNQKTVSGVLNGFRVYNNTTTSTIVNLGQVDSSTEEPISGITHVGTTGYTKGIFKNETTEVKLSTGTYSILATGWARIVGNFTATGEAIIGGNLTATGNVTAYSDTRLKTNLQTLARSIDGLTGYTFDWNGKLDRGDRSYDSDIGLLADEVEKVVPEAVFIGENGYKTVDYTRIIPLLVEELKALKLRVKELEDDTTV